MSTKNLLRVAVDSFPCDKSFMATTVHPDCISSEFGKCEVFENAIFCPKYGKMVGVFKHYGGILVDFEDVSE